MFLLKYLPYTMISRTWRAINIVPVLAGLKKITKQALKGIDMNVLASFSFAFVIYLTHIGLHNCSPIFSIQHFK